LAVLLITYADYQQMTLPKDAGAMGAVVRPDPVLKNFGSAVGRADSGSI
jgi:hypothetical protein